MSSRAAKSGRRNVSVGNVCVVLATNDLLSAPNPMINPQAPPINHHVDGADAKSVEKNDTLDVLENVLNRFESLPLGDDTISESNRLDTKEVSEHLTRTLDLSKDVAVQKRLQRISKQITNEDELTRTILSCIVNTAAKPRFPKDYVAGRDTRLPLHFAEAEDFKPIVADPKITQYLIDAFQNVKDSLTSVLNEDINIAEEDIYLLQDLNQMLRVREDHGPGLSCAAASKTEILVRFFDMFQIKVDDIAAEFRDQFHKDMPWDVVAVLGGVQPLVAALNTCAEVQWENMQPKFIAQMALHHMVFQLDWTVQFLKRCQSLKLHEKHLNNPYMTGVLKVIHNFWRAPLQHMLLRVEDFIFKARDMTPVSAADPYVSVFQVDSDNLEGVAEYEDTVGRYVYREPITEDDKAAFPLEESIKLFYELRNPDQKVYHLPNDVKIEEDSTTGYLKTYKVTLNQFGEPKILQMTEVEKKHIRITDFASKQCVGEHIARKDGVYSAFKLTSDGQAHASFFMVTEYLPIEATSINWAKPEQVFPFIYDVVKSDDERQKSNHYAGIFKTSNYRGEVDSEGRVRFKLVAPPGQGSFVSWVNVWQSRKLHAFVCSRENTHSATMIKTVEANIKNHWTHGKEAFALVKAELKKVVPNAANNFDYGPVLHLLEDINDRLGKNLLIA